MAYISIYGAGDNKEFTAPTANQEITIYCYNSTGKTAANDDPVNGIYYFSNMRIAKKFVLRHDQALLITDLGTGKGITLTDPITCPIGDGTTGPASGMHKEEYDYSTVHYIKLKILTANTNIKLRIY